MSMNVLWIVGTALAASADDPHIVAATDGQRIWLTIDAGDHWRRVADFGPGRSAPAETAASDASQNGGGEDGTDGADDDGSGDDGSGDDGSGNDGNGNDRAGDDGSGDDGPGDLGAGHDADVGDYAGADAEDAGPCGRIGAGALDVLAAMNGVLPPGEETAVRALAISGDTLFAATATGVYARPLAEPMIGRGRVGRERGGMVRIARDRLLTLAAADGTLWATTERALVRSDDGGRRFRAMLRLPAAVHGLAVTGGRAILATEADAYLVDPATGVSRALGVGVCAVAASADGSFWRAASDGIFRTRDRGVTWTQHPGPAARALAVGADDVWVATGGRVGRASDLWGASLAAAALPYRFYELEASALIEDGDHDAGAQPRGDAGGTPVAGANGGTPGGDDAASRPAARRRNVWLPVVSARARLVTHRSSTPRETGVYGWDSSEDEAVFEVVLRWDLDGGDQP